MADQRIQYTERMVGAGHPTYADTLNRLQLVEHNSDGTHKTVTQTFETVDPAPVAGAVILYAYTNGVTPNRTEELRVIFPNGQIMVLASQII